MSSRQRLHDLVRLTFRNRASLVYLSVVAATAVFVAIDTLFVTHEDASLAGVWLLLLAAPTIFAFFIGGSMFGEAVTGSGAFLYIALVLSVLIQSLALGLFVRLLRGAASPARPQRA
ncbi:SCO4225 family membrane protein [Streptomyces sp. A5-4]|uniref:SCO4225 family membrane protein n=1 Tax=Streptomyces sp. A5-4 TaxID=3384771 RepID=UPI003DA8A075